MKLLGMPCVASALGVVVMAFGTSSCGGSSAVTSPPATVPPATVPPATPTPDDPAASSCPLGRGVVDAPCGKAAPRLLASIEKAIDALVQRRPELFNKQEEAGANTRQYRVLDRDAYLNGVVDELRAAGHCAERSLDLERVLVKNTNSFSEEWDILTASGFIRRGSRAYQSTCTPAVFPVDPADYIAYVRTHLWGYECLSGITPPTPSERRIPIGCDGRVTATPKLRNGRDVPPRIHGPDVRWMHLEGHDVVRLDVDPRFPDNPFDKVLITSGKIGSFHVCATVQGKTGCLRGQTIP
jgi:hypothetical protein